MDDTAYSETLDEEYEFPTSGMVHCEECGNDYSAKERECPYCAADEKIARGGKPRRTAFSVILTVALVVGAVSLLFRAATSEVGLGAFGRQPTAISSSDLGLGAGDDGLSAGVVEQSTQLTPETDSTEDYIGMTDTTADPAEETDSDEA